MLIYDVILDAGTTGCQQTVCLYQGDDRLKLLRITLLQNGRVYPVAQGMRAELCIVKPDDTTATGSCYVRAGSVYCLPGAAMTDTPGTVCCQLRIRDGGATLLSPEFSMQIDASLAVPVLPEGAAEEAGFDAGTVSDLPQTADDGAIVYLEGQGFYRYADGTWIQLTSDGAIADVAALLLARHTHTNGNVLDRLGEGTNGNLTYKGRAVGLETVRRLPDNVEYGRVVYKNGDGLYVNVGSSFVQPMWTKITDDMGVTFSLVAWSMKHEHENKAVLDKLTAPNGSLLYDGKPAGVRVVSSPELLPADAPDGSVAAAAGNGFAVSPVVLPAQIADEQVEADIADTELRFGAPVYNASALADAITAQDIGAKAAVTLGNGAKVELSVMPVVTDVSDNVFTDGGVTLDPDYLMLAQSCTKNYVVFADFSPEGNFALFAPGQIVHTDSTHMSVPARAVYAFEDVSGTIGGEVSCTLHAGWNIVRVVIEHNGGSYVGVDGISVVNDADVNAVVQMAPDEENALTLDGMCASRLLAGVLERVAALPAGLYVKLGAWKRLAEADA